jgi:hypothetical protein
VPSGVFLGVGRRNIFGESRWVNTLFAKTPNFFCTSQIYAPTDLISRLQQPASSRSCRDKQPYRWGHCPF